MITLPLLLCWKDKSRYSLSLRSWDIFISTSMILITTGLIWRWLIDLAHSSILSTFRSDLEPGVILNWLCLSSVIFLHLPSQTGSWLCLPLYPWEAGCRRRVTGGDLTLVAIVMRRRTLGWWGAWIWPISGKQWAGSGNIRRQGQLRDGPGVGQRQKQFEARRRYELDITPGPLPRIRWFIELLCQQKTGVKWVSFDSDQILIQMMGRASGHWALLDN